MNNNNCSTSSSVKEFAHQKISLSNKFINLTSKNLRKNIYSNMNEEIYSYVLTTIIFKSGNFFQTGTGPNFEGGIITLCTCKHSMRAFKDSKDWSNVWICGLVNKKNNTYLQYLMKIDYAVDNMYDLFESLPHNTREIKSASINIFGDVYIPNKKLRDSDDKHKIENYNHPIEDHKHENKYARDLNSKSSKRFSSMLVGDKKNSFIWIKPTIKIVHPEKKKFTQGCKKWKVMDFLNQLI